MQPKPPTTTNVNSLQTEISNYANTLPYWGKILAQAILAKREIAEQDIDDAYNALLQDLKISPIPTRQNIDLSSQPIPQPTHEVLKFKELLNTVGVNALAQNQILKFNNNLTIIYGRNGSGKSGYTRLLKRVFYSKSLEDILPNVHINGIPQKPAALFKFSSVAGTIEIAYPEQEKHPALQQFAVFDGKGVLAHLDQRNQLEFRPAGLSFFSSYTAGIRTLEKKLQDEVRSNQGENIFPALFDGESEIKSIISNLSAKTNSETLTKFLPFTQEDDKKKKQAEIEYDEILLASKNKDKEITNLKSLKLSVTKAKDSLNALNKYFSPEAILKLQAIVSTFVDYQNKANAEGVSSFTTPLISEIGSPEWKTFIVASHNFALKQNAYNAYPEEGNNCLLCRQPLSAEAQALIHNYWIFIKSEAEKRAAESLSNLNQTKNTFEKLNFDIFPEESVLRIWLAENKKVELETLITDLAHLKALADHVITCLSDKMPISRPSLSTHSTILDQIEKELDTKIASFETKQQQEELTRLLKIKTLFMHREKLQQQFKNIDKYIGQQAWINKASQVNWGKRGVTETEKELSAKYFNEKYIDTFNKECEILDGVFGIEINHTGTAGTSYRQLQLRGKSPSSVLSEGEQKVIALADFISEMHMSDTNQGMIFDDPVNSLDEYRKKKIAEHLGNLSRQKQVIVFSHDLVFVSAMIIHCQENKIGFDAHWIEKRDNLPGLIFLNNFPYYEKEYRNSNLPMNYYAEAKRLDCPPSQRDQLIKTGFTTLRTCYEVLVINDLFKNVVQRFNDRVSIDSLKSVFFDQVTIDELMQSFGLCCRYMEGHSHSDAYAYRKPELQNLKEEIDRYEVIKKRIKDSNKTAS